MRRAVVTGGLYGLAVYKRVIESISDDFHTFVFLSTLSQAFSRFLPVEVLLGTAEGDVIEIGNAGILR